MSDLLSGGVSALLQRAVGCHQAGRLGEAEALYREVLGRQPAQADALRLLGTLLRDRGELPEGRALLEAATRARPKEPFAWLELALASLRLDAHDDAERQVRRALQVAPSLPEAHLLLGQVAMARGDAPRALQSFERAGSLRPGWPDALVMAGTAASATGNHRAAEDRFRAALALIGPHAGLFQNLGNALREQGRLEEAVLEFERALAADPRQLQVQLQLAQALHSLGRHDDALAQVDRALAREPDWAQAHFERGNLLYFHARYADAEAAFSSATALQPDFADAWYNLGLSLLCQERLDEAEQAYLQVLRLRPGDVHAQVNLAGIYFDRREFGRCVEFCRAASEGAAAAELHERCAFALNALGRTEEAVGAFDLAVQLAGERPPETQSRVRMERAAFWIAIGRREAGWREYAWRPSRSARPVADPGLVPDAGALRGQLAGRRFTVIGEQGLGDELFFLRFAPELVRQGAVIDLVCSPKLRAILRGHDAVFASVATAHPGGTQPVLLGGDLPEATGLGLAPPLPLQADDAERAAMAGRLAKLGPPPYLGVTWRAGLTTQEMLATRQLPLAKSVSPAALGRALKGFAGTILVLQRGPSAQELAALASGLERPAHDLSSLNDDLAGMLALLSLLDEYVGVSNTNMHMFAGIEGKHAKVLVPHPAEWRWVGEGGGSPWFRGFPLYHQRPDGDWSAALRALDTALRGSAVAQ